MPASKQPEQDNNAALIIELCAIDLSKIDKPQRISPKDAVIGRDGRTYIINAQTVIDNFNDDGLEVPLTAAHEWEGTACGWFTDYNEQDDGIYATLRTNSRGKTFLQDEQYKYLSPEYQLNYDTREVSRITAISLVNTPNVLNTALNKTQTKPEPEPRQETIVPKANLQTEDNALQTQVQTLQANNQTLTEANATLTEQNAALTKQVTEGRVDAAIAQGKLAPAKRDFAIALEANALDAFLQIEACTFKAMENNDLNPDAQDDQANCAIANLYNGE